MCKNFGQIMIMWLMFVAILWLSPVSASAGYDDAYNIHDAIQFAKEHANNNNFSADYWKSYDADCTNFVSSVLCFGGGLETDDTWYYNNGGSSVAWINTPKLYDYLKNKGYKTYSFWSYQDSIASFFCQPGDIVFYDWGNEVRLGQNDGKPDHAAFCVGINSKGIPLVAAHSNSHQSDPIVLDNGDYGEYKIYIVSMTDTLGLMDVTSRYIGKTVAIKSLEVNQYVSSNTDQDTKGINATANRGTASTWEYFDVVAGDYGEVGFKAHGNGNYLSARIDENEQYAYIQAAYGQQYTTPQSWESFRIFEKGGIQYIQSQANGKWVQVATNETDNPLKSAGASASTWERFQIEVVNTSSGSSGETSSGGGGTGGTSTGGGTGTASDSGRTTTVSQYYHASDDIEGWYEGEWRNGAPNGYGKLTYDDFDDGKYYALNLSDGSQIKALYYEGNFENGARKGSGIVVYENGYKEEGTYYGLWQTGKVVFEGKMWFGENSYRPLTMTATGARSATNSFGDLVIVGDSVYTYTIQYNANGGTGAPENQVGSGDQMLVIRSQEPTRTGYTFLGWSSSSTATRAEYWAGNLYGENVDVTLYAVWRKNDIEVFDSSSISDWAKSEVRSAYFMELIPESLQKDYTGKITRNQISEMIVNLIEKCSQKSIETILSEKGLTINSSVFQDTKEDSVLTCYTLGILNGVGNKKFAPSETLTRAQIAAILNRTACVLGIETDGYTHDFQDVSGHWVNRELGWPTNAGIIKGVGNHCFSPDSGLTVEQSIAIVYRAYCAIKKEETGFGGISIGKNDNDGPGQLTDENGNPREYSSNHSSGIDISNEDF